MGDTTLEKGIGELSVIVQAWLDRWRGAVEDSRSGRYSPDRFLADIVNSSVDAAKAWTLPYTLMMRGVPGSSAEGESHEIARLDMKVPAGKSEALGTTRFDGAADDELETSDLAGVDESISATNVHAHVTNEGRTLVVLVTALSRKRPDIYSGAIRRKGNPEPCASVTIEILEED